RRITGDEQFRQHHEIGAVGPCALARRAHFRGVALDVARGRIELGQSDGKLIGAFGHQRIVPRMRLNFNWRSQMTPMRSAIENSQKTPAVTSATPTAADPMSLTR